MAIGSSLPAQSIASLGASRQGSEGPPVGLRGAISLGSGLRSGVVLVDAAGRATAELQEAREAAAEAARDAARAEAELQTAETESARSEQEAAPRGPVNTSQFGLNDADAERSINAAQAAGESGEQTDRGSFVDLAV